MADFGSILTKRKLDQLEDETQFSSKKKIKAENNSHKEGNNTLLDLPPEILHFILSFITSNTQRRHIRSVCRLWFDKINYNEFNIGVLLKSEVEEFSRCFGRYQKPFGLKFRKISYLSNLNSRWNSNTTLMQLSDLCQSISSLTQLTSLDLQLKIFEIPPELVNLQSLTIISPLNGYTMSRLTNLRRLKTDSRLEGETPTTLESLALSDNETSITIGREYSRLTELVMSWGTKCEIPESLTNLRKLSDIGCSSLTNLMQQYPKLEELMINPASVDSRLIPTQHPSTLTKLHVLSYGMIDVNITDDLTQLKDLYCASVKFLHNSRMNLLEDCVVQYENETILEHLDSQKVTKLRISVIPENIHNLAKFTNLIDLDMSMNQVTADTMPYLVPLTRLTQLRLSYNTYPQKWMTELPNVIDLKLDSLSSTTKSINFEALHRLTSLELSGSYDSISIINLTNLLHLRIGNQDTAINIHGLLTASNLTILVCQNYNLQSGNPPPPLQNFHEVGTLTKLRVLVFDRRSNTEFMDITDLTALQRLTFLEVRATSESTWCLTRLSRLQKIYMYANQPSQVGRKGILRRLPFCYHFEGNFILNKQL